MPEHLVGKSHEIPEGGRKIVRIGLPSRGGGEGGDVEIGIFRLTGALCAYENLCLHQGGPVCEGQIMGRVEAVIGSDRRYLGERFSEEEIHIVCPWHGWEYDLATGACAADRRLHLKRYTIIERGGEVYVVI